MLLNVSLLSQCELPVLPLAQHVDPPTFDLTGQTMPLGRSLNDAAVFLRPWPDVWHVDLPVQLELHDATKAVLVASAATHNLTRSLFTPMVPSTALLVPGQ